jgi:hypothetical protein
MTQAFMRGLRWRLGVTAAAVLGLGLFACGDAGRGTGSVGDARPLEIPVPERSGQPFVMVDHEGRFLLSWVESREGGGNRLRFAALEGDTWAEPRTIAEGDGWFTNWADFPMMAVLPDGRLAAHYLVRSEAAEAGYHYDVRIVQSMDGGRTWSAPVTPHGDGVPAEHGFVSLFPDGTGLGAVWLDGRKFHPRFGATDEMTLRYTTIGTDGALAPEVVIDERICDCCQTAVAMTGRGPVVVYRDRTPDEIRDISLVRLTGGEWSAPRPVHRDGWQLHACPVNGPSVAAEGDRVAVAWFTGAEDVPRVLLAFSDDAGDTFSNPIRIDDGDPIGRVDVVMLPGGGALVTWMERPPPGNQGLVRFRQIDSAGRATDARTAGVTTAARQSGFPRMARSGNRIVLAWTMGGTDTRVEAALLELEAGE